MTFATSATYHHILILMTENVSSPTRIYSTVLTQINKLILPFLSHHDFSFASNMNFSVSCLWKLINFFLNCFQYIHKTFFPQTFYLKNLIYPH